MLLASFFFLYDTLRRGKEIYRPAEVHQLVGDASKARKVLGWKPKGTFGESV
jgi:GDPmannose 4,6-dehydratase